MATQAVLGYGRCTNGVTFDIRIRCDWSGYEISVALAQSCVLRNYSDIS
jgi:hypothetical protein